MPEHRGQSETWSAPSGVRVVLVIRDGRVVDGLIDQRDIQRQQAASFYEAEYGEPPSRGQSA